VLTLVIKDRNYVDTGTFFGIELPIIQSPLAGIQNSALTIAVSNAGGSSDRFAVTAEAQRQVWSNIATGRSWPI
jgi:hypothetical protein